MQWDGKDKMTSRPQYSEAFTERGLIVRDMLEDLIGGYKVETLILKGQLLRVLVADSVYNFSWLSSGDVLA